VEVASVAVAGESVPRLTELISTVLQPVTDESICLVYVGSTRGTHPLDDESDIISVDTVLTNTDDLEEEDLTQTEGEILIEDAVDRSLKSNKSADSSGICVISAPIFAMFFLDGVAASMVNLVRTEKTTTVSVRLSVFASDCVISVSDGQSATPPNLPSSHLIASNAISGLLNAFVAEQSLETLRCSGRTIDASNLRLAKSCLQQARSVISEGIDIFFYVPKLDAMMPARSPNGYDSEIETGFALLLEDLQNNRQFSLVAVSRRCFAVIDTETDTDRFAFWCFITIKKGRHAIFVQVYHPDTSSAVGILQKINHVISLSCHRVNQILLLQALHHHRVASQLLIESASTKTVAAIPEAYIDEQVVFQPGAFRCPTVFRKSFDLVHRCRMNPLNVARTIEATVLHIFAISNVHHKFVYKDESGSVFYMQLEALGGGVENDGAIELLVYGLDGPGKSVTSQLTALIQKRLMQIAVDMFSAVLTKNSHYAWKQSDLIFVQSYEDTWTTLDEGGHIPSVATERIYSFPNKIGADPAFLILYFRQNLCGSTYFHTLHFEGEPVQQQLLPIEDNVIRLKSLNPVFYYNNAPSKLNPRFQGQSTLTEKGSEYSRSAGTGIAIINLTFVDQNGLTVDKLHLGTPPEATACIPPSIPANLLRGCEEGASIVDVGDQHLRLKVSITDTAIRKDVLHDWVRLTLNQVLTSWTLERLLERVQRADFVSNQKTRKTQCTSESGKNQVIETISPGLPAVRSLLETALDLPHPAILKAEQRGVVRSSSVATLALNLLERTIVDQLDTETKGNFTPSSSIRIIRLSRNECPQRVELHWDLSGKKAVVFKYPKACGTELMIQDTAIDCPEYHCACFSSDYMTEDLLTGIAPVKLYEEVSIRNDWDDTQSAIPGPLQFHRQKYPSLFRRAFGFILIIRRNQRNLVTYNWNAKVFNTVVSRMVEKDTAFSMATNQSIDKLQRLSLQVLSPKPLASQPVQTESVLSRLKRNPEPIVTVKSEAIMQSEQHEMTGKKRRIVRPVLIRKPKLIGKSVDGAALHAVAASRARASSNLFKGGGGATTSRKGPSDESSRSGTQAQVLDKDKQMETREQLLEDKQVQFNAREIATLGDLKLQRLHTVQQRSTSLIAATFWTAKRKQTISSTALNFILSNSSFAWSDVSELLPAAQSLLPTFIVSLAHTLTAWVPGLQFVTLSDDSLRSDPTTLIGETKRLRNCKCMTVIQLSLFLRRINASMKCFVRINGWIVTLPRRRKFNTIQSYEKDSNGLDQLATDSRLAIPLRRILFDHMASLCERTMKSSNLGLTSSDVFGLLWQLTDPILPTYSLAQQMKMLRSIYKVYRATIVLSSYRDRLINSFKCHNLFRWLTENAESRNMISCGPEGLCFKRDILVRGTHTICFLACNRAITPGEMTLILLCRSQRRDLYEYTERVGSNVLLTIVDKIAVDAAELAFEGKLKYWQYRSKSKQNVITIPFPHRIENRSSLTTKRFHLGASV
jgi:hypothetical protein